MRSFTNTPGAMRWLLVVTAVFAGIVSTAGCSGKKSSVIPLEPIKFSDIEMSSPGSGKKFMELHATGSTKGYVTALKTCGYNEKASLKGTTRQIFVGLEKLKITNQGPVEFGDNRLWSVEAEALSDDMPIFVSSYTLKKEKCFIDFVLWAAPPLEKSDEQVVTAEVAALRSQFHTLVGQILPTV